MNDKKENGESMDRRVRPEKRENDVGLGRPNRLKTETALG